MPNKLTWYIHRLTKMPTAEVLYRLEHKTLKLLDKLTRKQQCPPKNIPTSLNLEKIHQLTQNVPINEIYERQQDLSPSIIDQADKYVANIHDIFGETYNYGNSIDWHLDPKTGNHWPLIFSGDINIRDGQPIGGPKFVWEVNRFYCMPMLGLAYKMTGDDKYAQKILELLRAWLQKNPYLIGVNWTSGIELGVRLTNFLWGLSLLKEYALQPEEMKDINLFAFLHAKYLYRYPSKYSSNNNHTIAEAFALFLVGIFFPKLTGADKWKQFGKEVLEQEATRQILPDGGSYEYSTTYLSFVFDFFLLYRLVCEKMELPYDKAVDDRLLSACTFIHSLVDSAGNMPNIGDQDSAILLHLGLNNHINFHSILNTGAVLFKKPAFIRPSFPDIKTSILLAELPVFSLEEEPPCFSPSATLFKESGLSVIRSHDKQQPFVFTGNATPLGMPPLYAHGHLDALSFTLSVGGHEIFVDPGTYLYHSGGAWRRYFRSTAAHNTIRINKVDLTKQVADFMFGEPYTITEHVLSTSEKKQITWRAAHDAYLKLDQPVKICREVTYSAATDSFSFIDSLRSSATFHAELFFHMHPACECSLSQKEVLISINGTPYVKLKFDNQLDLKCYKGSQDPLFGWFSPRFNEIEESTTIVVQGRISGNIELQTDIIMLQRQ